MFETPLHHLEGRRHVKDRLAALDGHNSPGRIAFPVTNPLHLINNRCFLVAGAKKIGVQGMSITAISGLAGCKQGLAKDLTAEYVCAADITATTAIKVFFVMRAG